MFYINGNPILAGEIEVLNTLKLNLEMNGIERFAQFKEGPRNIQFSCPIHNDGQERKPSCGISIVNKEGTPAGTVHCFTCGYTATLEQMISHCFGFDDNGSFGREWLVKNFLTISVENRKDIILDITREVNNQLKTAYITDEELDSYRYYHPYMFERKLTEEVIEKFDIGYDPKFILVDKVGRKHKPLRCLTFPVRDINGNTLFIARRSVDIKLFHYPEGVFKPIYGLYELPEDADEIIIAESILNALTCYAYGKPAVALLGLGTEKQYEQLKQLKCRKLIIALDPDEAGSRATERIKKAMRGHKLITTYEIPPGKDLNDLSREEFENLKEIF